jgi:REase_AHJR-like
VSASETDWLSLSEPWRSLATKYLASGYNVYRGADVREDWLSPFEPDLIANRGDQWVVIEVKRADELTRSPDLVALARAVEERPRWRLELFVVGRPEPRTGEPPLELSVTELRAMLDRGLELWAQDPEQVGPLFLAAAFEAEARALLSQVEPGPVPKILTPAGLAKGLLSHGFIDDDEYGTLMQLLDYRNRIAHGYGPQAVDTQDIVAESERVIAILTRLLGDVEAGSRWET